MKNQPVSTDAGSTRYLIVATHPQRFVIIATPRSGSNWLCTLLNSHPDILCHHELFNPDGVHIAWSLRGSDFDLGGPDLQREKPLELLNRAWSQSLGHACVGFKINRGQSEAAFSAVLQDPAIRKILVSRKNRVRAFVSETIAEINGQWESFPDSPPPTSVQPVTIDPQALKSHAQANQAYLEEIRQLLDHSGQAFFETYYENIGKLNHQHELLDFLGVEQNVELKGQTRRMNPEPLESLIQNHDALAAELEDTGLADDLIEEQPCDQY
ncbi:MAG TPA: hypothetical protein VJ984_01600 [Xanthomonadales bacterium]|nr:hypothetical protein [Xanthomonadales bacterium]